MRIAPMAAGALVICLAAGCGASRGAGPLPSERAIGQTPTCRISQLSLVGVASQPQGTDRGVEEYAFRNISGAGCVLKGVPTITEAGPQGGSAVSTANPAADNIVTVYLPPHGGLASFFLSDPRNNQELCVPKGYGIRDVVSVTPPGVDGSLTMTDGMYCNDEMPAVSSLFEGQAPPTAVR